MNEYIDIGANLTSSAFKDDVFDVIERATAAGVTQLVVTGADEEHSVEALRLAKKYPSTLYCTAGVHPHHADAYTEKTTGIIRDLCANEEVVAIGECGLDYYRNFSTHEHQLMAFTAQLELAVELQKPVFLHQRDGHQDFVTTLSKYNDKLVDAVAHCFTGTIEELKTFNEMDLYIGVTGWICDERRGGDLRAAVKEIPLNRIMIETDAPYLLPDNLQEPPLVARRNEPSYLPHICSVIAENMGITQETLINAAFENTQRFFRLV